VTPAEFLSEASGFGRGSFVIVSGNDDERIGVLLSGAQMVIESGGIPTLLYDSRDTELQTVPMYLSCDAKFEEDRCSRPSHYVGMPWESKVLLASGSMVTLVGNFFDDETPRSNPWRSGIPADVVIDILEWYNVGYILDSFSKKYGNARNLFPFITKLYWYDGPSDDITHVKDQEAELPRGDDGPSITDVRSIAESLPVGPTVGRQVVTIRGDHFYPGAKVLFDDEVATDVSIVNEKTIRCLTPEHALGASDVSVTTRFGTAVLQSGFYFVS